VLFYSCVGELNDNEDDANNVEGYNIHLVNDGILS